MHFKTIEDYFNAATSHGFEIVDFTEARVCTKDMHSNISFFSNVNGHPLHIVMKIRKPMDTNNGAALGSINTLDFLPEKLNWPSTVTNNVENSLVMWLPPAANDELVDAALQVHKKGISVDNLVIGEDIDLPPKSLGNVLFSATKHFAEAVRSRLLHETGAVLVKGLDMNALGGVEQLDMMTQSSKIAYFILAEHIGIVDATARGKLFDVKRCVLRANELQLYSLGASHLVLCISHHFPLVSLPLPFSANIDAMSKSNDNVLFSVSDTEAGWHTDGASKDRVYDVVSLLCISPSTTGGKFRISNACESTLFLSHTIALFSHLF